MARKPLLTIRVDDETKARWQAAADRSGYTLSEYVRAAVDDRADGPARATARKAAAPKPAAPSGRGSKRERTEICVHRRGPDMFCPRCDA